MNSKVKRYVTLMIVGILLNYGFYMVAHFLHIPVWMDSMGTMYAAIVLEPAAGLLVGLATNFLISALIYGPSSLVYYLVSATTALVFGVVLRRNGKLDWKKFPKTLLLYLVLSTILSSALTLIINGGVSNSTWEHQFFSQARDMGIPLVLSCMWGTFVLKVGDTLVAAVVIPIVCKLTPKSMITEDLEENLSWKAPFRERVEKEQESS